MHEYYDPDDHLLGTSRGRRVYYRKKLKEWAMGAGNPDWLREHTDDELLAIAAEMEERAEQFNSEARSLMNDELRRRKLPVIGVGKSRH